MAKELLKCSGSEWTTLFFALSLVSLFTGCKKNDDDSTPKFNYTVTYTVGAIGDVEIDQISFTDEEGNIQIVENERDWSTVVTAPSGSRVQLGVSGRLVNGAVYIDLTAQASGAPTVNKNDQDGYNGGGNGKLLDMTVETILD